jgi:hypothetical protein
MLHACNNQHKLISLMMLSILYSIFLSFCCSVNLRPTLFLLFTISVCLSNNYKLVELYKVIDDVMKAAFCSYP